jgi:hypothetical protein
MRVTDWQKGNAVGRVGKAGRKRVQTRMQELPSQADRCCGGVKELFALVNWPGSDAERESTSDLPKTKRRLLCMWFFQRTLGACTVTKASMLILGSALLFTSAPESRAQSLNCQHAKAPDVALICQDAGLLAMDERQATLFFRLRSRLGPSQRADLEYDEQKWLRSRHLCGWDGSCIAASYELRMRQLGSY